MMRLCFVGDIFPGGVFSVENGLSQEVISLFNGYDLRIANLESSLYNGKCECKIKMSDPKLGNLVFSPEESIRVLKELKIDVVSLANNHVCDCGYDGLARTIELLDEHNIAHFGAGRTEDEACTPAIVNIKGKSLCFLGYFPPEWEAPYPPHGSIGGLNQMITEKVIDDIKKYKKTNDFVFVVPHWGKEHTIFPLLVDVRRMHDFVNAGVDGIFAAHAHCPQTFYLYKNVAIAMSMGNLLFPDRYIISPRKTYYPTWDEIKDKNIPITYEFPFVDELTMVKMHENGRIGLVCELTIDNDRKMINSKYTILDNNNILRPYNMSILEKFKINSVKWLISNYKFYYLFCRVMNIFQSRIFHSYYRFGTWNVR